MLIRDKSDVQIADDRRSGFSWLSVSRCHAGFVLKKWGKRQGFDLDVVIITSCGAIRLLEEHHRKDGHGCKLEWK